MIDGECYDEIVKSVAVTAVVGNLWM